MLERLKNNIILRFYHLQNMQQELEDLENKILTSKKVTRYDLMELEGLANEIAILQYKVNKED